MRMSGTARVLIADPRAETVAVDGGRWILSGFDEAALAEAVREADDPVAARDSLPDVAEDATAVFVADDGERVLAYRSITGTRDVYYLRDPDGGVAFADHFRNAVAQLDAEERDVTERAVADHLLFRGAIEPRTYVEGVRALTHGEWLEWTAADGEFRTEQIERLSAAGHVSPSVAPAAIDDVLSDLVEQAVEENTANMLSGGVDSTLLHTYAGSDTPAFIMSVDSPEFQFETEYAREARDMLGTDAREVTVAEDDFLDLLERSVDSLGFPAHYAQTITTDAAMARDDGGDHYLHGEKADTLFGRTRTKGCRIATWLDPLLSTTVGDCLPEDVPARDTYRELAGLTDRLRRPLSDPRSLAHDLGFYTDPDVVAAFVGESLVDDRVAEQTRYLRDRIERDPGSRFAQQVEFGHLLGFLRSNVVNQWRHLGYVHGKSVSVPFSTKCAAECALSVPAERRYIQGPTELSNLTQKYLLKSLLGERLPEYPVCRKKGSGSLPVERFFDEGCLADVFDRYDPPSFVPDELYESHVENYSPLTWNLIIWAVWEDRVLNEPNLDLVDGTRRLAPTTAEPTTGLHR